MKICSIKGCSKRVASRGWCQNHYRHFRLYGHPLKGPFFKPANKKCSIKGCKNTGYMIRGLCGKHYWRLKEHGDPNKLIRAPNGAADKWLKKVAKTTEREKCIEFPYGRSKQGYGATQSGTAHRKILEIKLGRKIKPGFQALHHCDNRPCCNPWHIYEGTQQDNINDMKDRNRFNNKGFKGENHPGAKLTDAQVKQIRILHKLGHSATKLGKKFGVSSTSIMDICNGKSWSHITFLLP